MTENGPPPEEPPGYKTEQFAFVHEEAPPEEPGWLAFGDSRAGRRADRRERFRERAVAAGVLVALVALVGGLLLWRPWAGSAPADTGDELLGGDRAVVLLQVQDANGSAAYSGLLLHDRREDGSGAAVTVPADLSLPVAGEDALTLARALEAAGPTRTRDSLAELLGVDIAGSWVMDRAAFAAAVDGLGGLPTAPLGAGSQDAGTDAAGPVRDGAAALAALADPASAGELIRAFCATFPPTFTGSRDLLAGLGVLDSPGLPVDRLGAVMAGLARDAGAGRLQVAALPLEPSGGNLDVAGALPVVRDVLGGAPGQGRGEDLTPRVMVRLAPGAGATVADVRADVVNAGYEYVDGGRTEAAAAGSVTVREGLPDAQALGESVARALGLPTSVVRVAPDVPFVADVLVVLGA